MAAPSVVGTPVNAMYTNPFSITPGSGANYVIAGMKLLPAGTIRTASATYDGNSMTARTYQYDDSVNPFNGLARFVYAPPGTGAKNISTSVSGGQGNSKAACTLTDVDTGSPLGTAVDNNGSGTSATATITADTNALAFAIVVVSGTATLSAGTGETIVTQRTEDGETIALITKAGASSVSFAPTWTGSFSWGITAFAVNGTVSGPTISVQPSNATAVVNDATGNTATFSVTASGTGTLVYDWELETSVGGGVYANLADGSGATWTGQAAASCTGTFTATTLTGRRVRCNVTDDNGSVTSNTATLTVLTGDTITQPSGTTNGSGVITGSMVSTSPGLTRLTAIAGGVTLNQVVVITKR